tara:strand:- start:307 stop:468 length:162 start_codon:yes stop_codon:yes gene_type:complete
MMTEEEAEEMVATEEVAVDLIDLTEEEDAVVTEAMEEEVMIGFQRIRIRPKRY